MYKTLKTSSITRRSCFQHMFVIMLLFSIMSGFLIFFSCVDGNVDMSENLQILRESELFSKRLLERKILDISVPVFTYNCISGKCVKVPIQNWNKSPISLETCNMLCASPPLWPKPTTVNVTNKDSSAISATDITFAYNAKYPIDKYLEQNIGRFMDNIKNLTKNANLTYEHVKIKVKIILDDYNSIRPKSDTEESYKLVVKKETEYNVSVSMDAVNRFGARHALETLSQLIWYDSASKSMRILHDVEIKDSPVFQHRGLMVDTARNFFPLSQLYKVIDGMAASKLNVFHLHLTDAESFPIILESVPHFAYYGSYDKDKMYKSEEIKKLIEYAEVNGIRVILEIDGPSHVNTGWNLANISKKPLVICGESYGLKGHLNPDNDDVLHVLQSIYSDLIELNGNSVDYFHIGGDEVILDCWRNTTAAQYYQNLTQLWANYTNKIIQKVKSANGEKYPKNIVIWSSPLTSSKYFKNLLSNITVQFWLGQPLSILQQGRYVIYSSVGYWYLDCGFGPYKPRMFGGNCDPYIPWQKMYAYRPWSEFGYIEQTLGGEVLLWTEQVDVEDLETRIWPRAAAFAERLWSDPYNFDEYDVYTRLVWFRKRLIGRGLRAAGLWPEWCSQNPGLCRS